MKANDFKKIHRKAMIFFAFILFLSSVVNAAEVSHPAGEIKAGTFGAGNYAITNNNEVDLTLINTESDARQWALVSAGSIGGIDKGKFSIYDKTVDKSRLVIDTDGNVGIGTTKPGANLEVAGNIKIADGTQGTGKVLTSDANGLASWKAPSGGGPSGCFMSQWNVGNPSSSIFSVGNNDKVAFEGKGATSVSFDADKKKVVISSGAVTGFWAQDGSDISNTNSGNVGIGASPAAANKLDVAGKIHATGDVCTDASGGKCLSSSGGDSFWSKSGDDIRNTNSGRVWMQTLSSGYVETNAIVSSVPTGSMYLMMNPGNDFGIRIPSGNIIEIGSSASNYKIKFFADIEAKANAFKPGGGSWADSSDIRLKKNIKPLQGSLDKLLQLRGVNYEWKEPEKQGNLTGTQIGMIGQDVEKVFPEWVGTDLGGYKTLGFRGFEALTVESLRELKNENEMLKARIEILEGKLNNTK